MTDWETDQGDETRGKKPPGGKRHWAAYGTGDLDDGGDRYRGRGVGVGVRGEGRRGGGGGGWWVVVVEVVVGAEGRLGRSTL